MERRNIYYLTCRKDKNGKKTGWEVKIEKAKKVTGIFETKEKALAKIRQLAGNKGATVIVYKLDGTVQTTKIKVGEEDWKNKE